MKNLLVILLVVFCNQKPCSAQDWMTSLPVAKKLALAQNKFIFMMWEESALYQTPVLLENNEGKPILERDFLNNKRINEAIWEYFVPVIVSESEYEELYNNIKGKRRQGYLTVFNDDSMKIMDPNGNIIGSSPTGYMLFNLSIFLKKYAYKTVFLENELRNYNKEKEFFSTLYLANRFIDFAIYVNSDIRKEVLNLTTIYFNEARLLLSQKDDLDKARLSQRLELYELNYYLVQKRPKKVLREIRKIEKNLIKGNEDLIAYLFYTSYLILEDEKNIELWKNKVSLVNLKKAQLINKI